MNFTFDQRQLDHDPEHYFRRGALVGHPEQPARATLIREALLAGGHAEIAPRDHGTSPIVAVHDQGYVEFMLEAWRLWNAAAPDTAAAVPNYHPGRRLGRVPQGVFGKLGHYVADTGCPIVEGSARAIYWSAQSAAEAATRVAAGQDRCNYALCRPPGHHAYRDQANGFCFFNNAAVAAQVLRSAHARVAVLDIDTHGGNGTQDIFYDRQDVLVASIHVDPSDYPPYYTGYPDETGDGPGIGANLNLLLSAGDGEDRVLVLLDRALNAIAGHGATALVVSLGVDMAADDPLSVVGMTTDGFRKAAAAVASVGLPTVIVQEGGYLGPSLAANVLAFVDAFEANCRPGDNESKAVRRPGGCS